MDPRDPVVSQSATKIDSIEDMVAEFSSSEDRNFSLINIINDLNKARGGSLLWFWGPWAVEGREPGRVLHGPWREGSRVGCCMGRGGKGAG